MNDYIGTITSQDFQRKRRLRSKVSEVQLKLGSSEFELVTSV